MTTTTNQTSTRSTFQGSMILGDNGETKFHDRYYGPHTLVSSYDGQSDIDTASAPHPGWIEYSISETAGTYTRRVEIVGVPADCACGNEVTHAVASITPDYVIGLDLDPLTEVIPAAGYACAQCFAASGRSGHRLDELASKNGIAFHKRAGTTAAPIGSAEAELAYRRWFSAVPVGGDFVAVAQQCVELVSFLKDPANYYAPAHREVASCLAAAATSIVGEDKEAFLALYHALGEHYRTALVSAQSLPMETKAAVVKLVIGKE